MLNPRALTLVAMILAAAATRIIPHPWNFTAVGAMCLFGGAYFQRRWMALLVPMAALFLSDIVLAATLYGFRGLNVISMSYFLFALTTLLFPALVRAAESRPEPPRVVTIASIAHKQGRLNFDDLQSARSIPPGDANGLAGPTTFLGALFRSLPAGDEGPVLRGRGERYPRPTECAL